MEGALSKQNNNTITHGPVAQEALQNALWMQFISYI